MHAQIHTNMLHLCMLWVYVSFVSHICPHSCSVCLYLCCLWSGGWQEACPNLSNDTWLGTELTLEFRQRKGWKRVWDRGEKEGYKKEDKKKTQGLINGKRQSLEHVIALPKMNSVCCCGCGCHCCCCHHSAACLGRGLASCSTNALSHISRGQCQQQFIEATELNVFLPIWHLPREQREVPALGGGRDIWGRVGGGAGG